MRAERQIGLENSAWTAVVAMSRNGVIGRDGELPWHIRSDLKRFKKMTMGQCLLMGRKTFQSIGRALPGRQTIVLSRRNDLELPAGVSHASELSRVPQLVEGERDVMVVGGAEIYAATLSLCNRLWLTRVLADIEGDTFFPEVDWEDWRLVESTKHAAEENDQWETEFQLWTRYPS